MSTVPLPADSGLHRATIATTTSGVYRVLVRAEGADLRGAPFTREELRTVAVWARGDDRPPLVLDPGAVGPGGLDTCTLLLCLLGDDGPQAPILTVVAGWSGHSSTTDACQRMRSRRPPASPWGQDRDG